MLFKILYADDTCVLISGNHLNDLIINNNNNNNLYSYSGYTYRIIIVHNNKV